jgi:phosphoribosylformylglycinamidine cyclo-ligase
MLGWRPKEGQPVAITYQDSGVDPAKAAKILGDFGHFLKSRPRDPALLSGIGPFAACYSLKGLLNKYDDPVLVTCCDGVGTKAKLAEEWNAIDGLGQDLVAMNVNDLICAGAEPLLFLDYYATGKLSEPQLTKILHSIQSACELSNCTLAGGETAEMPGLYSGTDFDLAGFSVGIGERAELLGPDKVKVGDAIVAVASSGLHSNGFSLVRKLVLQEKLVPTDPTPFGQGTWKSVLLCPTTLYVSLFKGWSHRLHALAHLTGGGLFENLPRVLPNGVRAKIQGWEFPPLYQWIQAKAGLGTEQMLSTFNCGVGMVAILPADSADSLVASAARAGIPAWKAGAIEAGPSAFEPPVVEWE